ncbi:hypothetical protein [Paraburkholderia phenoliruptrix]|uniref:hypothetical protein n=1 Tax=Paraburkholderia phenoliruptrix TaxID=252970 RepID=UPI003D96F8F9
MSKSTIDKGPLPLTADRWRSDEEPEFSRVRSAALADINRASRGIASIARILHNSIGDDIDGVTRSTIDNFTKQNLAGAVECMSDFIYSLLEEEAATQSMIDGLRKGSSA